MKVSLRRNSSDNSSLVPYFAHIEIETVTIDLEATFDVPIYAKPKNGGTQYMAEVCGFQVEADTPESIIALVEKLTLSLINLSRLPTYVFIARRSHKMYPVYTVNDEVFATTPGGPVFKHVELAKVREFLADYLHDIEALGVTGKSEKLHVRGVRRSTLALTRPICYLKKRSQMPDDEEFWAPVFLTDDESAIYTFAASGRREIDVVDGYEVLLLRSQVAQALIADKRLQDNYALRPDRLLPEYWNRVKGTLTQLPQSLNCDNMNLELYKNGKFVVAVEHRASEDRYSLYVSKDVDELCRLTAQDLIRRGLVSNPAQVQLQEGVITN